MRSVLFALVVLCAATADAQVDSGSTGADGALVLTTFPGSRFADPALGVSYSCTGPEPLFPDACDVTIQLREPPNHIFHFTTVTVGGGITLRFIPNLANTPVMILA